MRKTKTTALALCIGMTLAMPAAAEKMTVFGSRSCGKWIAARAERGDDALGAVNWLMGYASGYVMALGVDALRGLDAESLWLYTDNYCRANPLKPAAYAIMNLVEERRQAGAK